MRFILQTFLIAVIAAIVSIAGLLWYLNQQLPDVNTLRNVQMQVPLRVYSADNRLIAEFGEMRRQPVPLSQIPVLLQEALIATEDQRFYEHSGVDFRGLIRAAFEVWQTGRKVQGGSTITMQVARNFFLDPRKTYTRKLKEILLALKISREFSKEKVLELYLNQVYFGKRAYGVAAAAQVYYGKSLDQLTLAQMAVLAGLPQSPSAANPVNDPAAALDRRNHVLSRMLEEKYITQAQYQEAVAESIVTKYHGSSVELNAPYVAEMARDAMVKQYGDAAYTTGLTVYTTVNSRDQLAATRAIEQGLLAYDKRHGYRGARANWGAVDVNDYPDIAKRLIGLGSVADIQPALVVNVASNSAKVLLANQQVVTIPWAGLVWARPPLQGGKWLGAAPKQASDVVKVGDVVSVQPQGKDQWTMTQLPEAEASLISLNPQTGAILALVGGFNFQRSNFNRVTSAMRQPGSSFKPIIYSAALSQGDTLATIVNDAPYVVSEPGKPDYWRPQNDDLIFRGPMRLRAALMKSVNLVSVRLVLQMGVPYLVKYAQHFGLDDAALPPIPSLALGVGSVTPIEMARAQSVFANGGYLIDPYLINKVIDNKGNTVFEAQPKIACMNCAITGHELPDGAPRIISAQNAYLINSAMKSVITSGTGSDAMVLGRSDLAGKTGTSNDFNDIWFDAFNTQVLAVVWLGYDQPRSTFEFARQGPLPIWVDYMRTALAGMPPANLPQPPGIVSARINAKTGLATDDNDPNAMFELFAQGTVPRMGSSGDATASSGGDDNKSAAPIF